MSRVVVVGSANMDLVVSAPTLPRPGETVLGDTFTTVPGGKGANQAIAAARAGAQCSFIGAVGQDSFGEALRDNLRANGVDVSRLRQVPGPSGVALIAVDADAENLIVVAPGANAALDKLDVQDRHTIETADVLLCQLEIPLPTVAQAAAAARPNGTLVMLNAAPARPLPPELLAAVDVLIVNELEGAALPLVQVPRTVLTLGARGAAYLEYGTVKHEVPAPRIDAIDTTGAGDAFAGALAVAWAQGRPAVDAMHWACAAGAVAATKRGAVMPTAAEIDGLYRV